MASGIMKLENDEYGKESFTSEKAFPLINIST